MRKLSIFFPGIGYTLDKPLLYYSKKLMEELGYETFLLSYHAGGKNLSLEDVFEIALKQAREMLQMMELTKYSEIILVGKSMGTMVASEIAKGMEGKERLRFIYYTPLEETFEFFAPRTIVFTGTADPWVGGRETKIPAICRERGIPCEVYEGANHSLETGNLDVDIMNMKDIMMKTKNWIHHTV